MRLARFLLIAPFIFLVGLFTIKTPSIAINCQGTSVPWDPSVHFYCTGSGLDCPGQWCGEFGPNDQARVICSPPGDWLCQITWDTGGNNNAPEPAPIWIRVLSQEAGTTVAWKGSGSNDPIQAVGDVSKGGLNGSGNFTTYSTTQNGGTKTWDTSKNRIDSTMSLSITNVISPRNNEGTSVGSATEYWSNHFCVGGFAENPDGKYLTVYQSNSLDRSCVRDDHGCKQDGLGCWSIMSGEGDYHYDWWPSGLNPVIRWEEARDWMNANRPGWPVEDLNWADLRYDEYWSNNTWVEAREEIKINLTPPNGYKCKNISWIKKHEDHAEFGIAGDTFTETIDSSTCEFKSSDVKTRGNLIVFELETNDTAVPVCGTPTYNPNSSVVQGTSINVSYPASDSGVGITKHGLYVCKNAGDVTNCVNGTEWQAIVDNSADFSPIPNDIVSGSLSTGTLTSGNHMVAGNFWDGSGNFVQCKSSITVTSVPPPDPTDTTPPTTPSNLATPSCEVAGNETLTWSPSTDPESGIGDYAITLYKSSTTSNPPTSFSLVGTFYRNTNAFSYGFATNYAYKVEIKARNTLDMWSGLYAPLYFYINTLPAAPSNLTIANVGSPANSLRLTWQDNSNNELGFKGYRADVPQYIQYVGIDVTSYTDSIVSCNGTSYIYTISARNSCGESPTITQTATCGVNNPPSCTIEYSSNGSTWTAYDNNLVHPINTQINIRANCIDSDGISSYQWDNTGGTFGEEGNQNPLYRTVFANSASPQVQVIATDTFGVQSLPVVVTVKTAPPAVGTHAIVCNEAGGCEIARPSGGGNLTTDPINYNYRVNSYQYNNSTGTPVSGKAIIDTTSSNVNGVKNICKILKCSFVSTSTSVSASIASGQASVLSAFRITASGGNANLITDGLTLHGIGIRFASDDNALSQNTYAVVNVSDATPVCSVSSIAPISPSNTIGNITFNSTGTDDWGMDKLNIDAQRSGGPVQGILTKTYNPTVLTANESVSWNVSNVSTWPDGSYTVNTKFWDLYASTPSSCPFTYVIDRTPPPPCDSGDCDGDGDDDDNDGEDDDGDGSDDDIQACVPITVSPAEWDGSTNPTVSFTATDNLSGVAWYELTYRNITTGATGLITNGNVSPPNVNYSNAVIWDVSTLVGGTYKVIGVYRDAAGNTSSQCESSNNFGKGNRYSGYVSVQSDDTGPAHSGFDRAKKEASGTDFVVYGATWNGTPANCNATYPDANSSNDHDCQTSAYFVSDAIYPLGTQANAVVKVGITGVVEKYTCQYSINGGIKNTREARDDGGTLICDTGPFDLSEGTGTAFTEWPTKVEFFLTYNTDRVVGRVWKANSTGTLLTRVNATDYSVISDGKTSSGSGVDEYFLPMSLDIIDFLQSSVSGVDKTFTLTGQNLTDYLCVAIFSNAQVDTQTVKLANYPLDDVKKIVQNLSTSGLSAGSPVAGWNVGHSANNAANTTCSSTFTLKHGALSPLWQNELHFILVPKLKFTGNIKFVEDSAQCDDLTGAPDNTAYELNLTPSQINSDPIVSGPQITNVTSSYTITWENALIGNSFGGWDGLAFSINAEVADATESLYVRACNDGVSSIDVSGADNADNYPFDSGVINNDFAVFIKESNNFTQTYNGGIHSNNSITMALPLVPTAGSPIQATLLGIPNVGILELPNKHPLDAGYYSSGVVSTTLDTITIPVSDMSANTDDDWLVVLAGKFKNPYDDDGKFFEKVAALVGEGTWDGISGSDINGPLNSNSGFAYYFEGSATASAPSPGGLKGPKLFAITENLTINGDIEKQNDGAADQFAVFVVGGNVTITEDVTEINAVIFANGDEGITIESKGADLDITPLLIRGGLYANKLVLNRDLKNVDAFNNIINFGQPAEQILFNPEAILHSPDFPLEVKETKTYWVVDR